MRLGEQPGSGVKRAAARLGPRLALLLSWTAVLAAMLTVADESRVTLLDPLSAEQGMLLAAYLATSLWWIQRLRSARLATVHLLVVAVFLVTHPLTDALGRDGTFAFTSLHLAGVAWWLTAWRAETRLLLASLLVGLATGETALSVLDRARPSPGALLDYGDLMGADGEGGFLVPNLRARVVGAQGPVEFVTESHGFRNREEVPREKPAGRRRLFIVGDSFVAGYRTDQERTVGRALELRLRERRTGGAATDVVVVGAGHPGAARDWFRKHGFRFEPDLLVVAVTLGNDPAQSWLQRQQSPESLLAGLLLPADAFLGGFAEWLPLKSDRTLRRWRLYRRARRAFATDVITSWHRDVPGRVHQLDPGHALGLFFALRPLPAVEQALAGLLADLRELREACAARGVPLLVALVPQRFQTSLVEWTATGYEYGLELQAFERERPNRILLEGCVAAGIDCVDLLPGFSGGGQPALYQPLGDMHWSDAGHALAARLLAEQIERR